MNCNVNRNTTENRTLTDFFTNNVPLCERREAESIIENLRKSTRVKELEDTLLYINDPCEDLMTSNLRNERMNCAVISPDKTVKIFNCKVYDIPLLVGANRFKVINFDYDKVLMFDPEAFAPNYRRNIRIHLEYENETEDIYDIYGDMCIFGIDWETNRLKSLSEADINRIKNYISQNVFPILE